LPQFDAFQFKTNNEKAVWEVSPFFTFLNKNSALLRKNLPFSYFLKISILSELP